MGPQAAQLPPSGRQRTSGRGCTWGRTFRPSESWSPPRLLPAGGSRIPTGGSRVPAGLAGGTRVLSGPAGRHFFGREVSGQ